jgi:hypothetical protein
MPCLDFYFYFTNNEREVDMKVGDKVTIRDWSYSMMFDGKEFTNTVSGRNCQREFTVIAVGGFPTNPGVSKCGLQDGGNTLMLQGSDDGILYTTRPMFCKLAPPPLPPKPNWYICKNFGAWKYIGGKGSYLSKDTKVWRTANDDEDYKTHTPVTEEQALQFIGSWFNQ